MFRLSLDIIVGIEAAKLSPIENLIAEEIGEKRKAYTHREKGVHLLRV